MGEYLRMNRVTAQVRESKMVKIQKEEGQTVNEKQKFFLKISKFSNIEKTYTTLKVEELKAINVMI